MHLPQVGLRGVALDARAMLHCLALMGVTRDAEPGQELDALLIRFAHRVRPAAADRRHHPAHRLAPLSLCGWSGVSGGYQRRTIVGATPASPAPSQDGITVSKPVTTDLCQDRN